MQMTKYLESLIGPEKILVRKKFRKAYEEGVNWGGQFESTDLYNIWTKIVDELFK